MKFPQKLPFQWNGMRNAGGMDNVPPAPCLRSAHASAYSAAYVARTGRLETKEIAHERTGRPEGTIKLVLRGGLA